MSASWEGANIDPSRIMEANDVAEMIYGVAKLHPRAAVPELEIWPTVI